MTDEKATDMSKQELARLLFSLAAWSHNMNHRSPMNDLQVFYYAIRSADTWCRYTETMGDK